MTDTMIKSAGNSRKIRTVPNARTLYPTWEAFIEAFATTGIPIDLGDLNSAGVQIMGTPYNKANVLPDATCNSLGIATSAVPKDAFNQLRTLVRTAQDTADTAQSGVNAAPKVLAGSYTGTGGAKGLSESNPMSLTFPFAPKIVFLLYAGAKFTPKNFNVIDVCWAMQANALTTDWNGRGFGNAGAADCRGKKSADGKTFYWYGETGVKLDDIFNTVNVPYRYIAIS